ncbi:MAG TPA: crossover junction endodeoxyribonuclease RuvC [Gemmatimonadales bacterium]|nr:crossover junction endodeoxyribonuclease RuvC [Gemmatimonadales bacterium]
MKVLGVDPGTAVTGYGIVERNGTGGPEGRFGHLIECGVIRLPRTGKLEVRLAELYGGIIELIARHRPTHLALEDAFYHKNVRTTLVLGHARGVVLLAAAQQGVAIAEYSPARIKKTVAGAGGAPKAQVAAMVAKLLRLRTSPKPSDAADGVAVALTHIIRS